MSNKSKHVPVTSTTPSEAALQLGLDRLVFFSDAVFAIAITLLALEIRLPAGDFSDDAALWQALLSMTDAYLAFAISFWVIASFWLGHHRMFLQIRRYDERLLFLNFLLLMLIAVVPFPTTLISEYGNRTAVIVYASFMVAIGLTMTAIIVYASGPGKLTDASQPISMSWRQRGLTRSLAVALVFGLSIGIAFIDPDWAMYSWLMLIPLSIWRRRQSNP
ncbi:MAG: DUF1211 domain-containing membrane protein [Chloroflexota bacterium]|nr:MAG: DUF1211 domain-containing membrane protein [Chloroflexota bacterium]